MSSSTTFSHSAASQPHAECDVAKVKDRALLVLRERDDFWLVELDSDSAMTLLATLSEDPVTRQDMLSCWPRYRTPVVPTSLDGLNWRVISSSQVDEIIHTCPAWAWIDLKNKCLITSQELSLGGREVVFNMIHDSDCVSGDGRDWWPLSVSLPPWWQLIDGATQVVQSADEPTISPICNRQVLYGDPLVEFLAREIVSVFGTFHYGKTRNDKRAKEIGRSGPGDSGGSGRSRVNRHQLVVKVHRNWLLTPRTDLGDKCPRQHLHGAHAWMESLLRAQELRADSGLPLYPLELSFSGYNEAPMGSQEVIVYFDLCRFLIESGANWLDSKKDQHQAAGSTSDLLTAFLRQERDRWLRSSEELGACASLIIDCNRRRVPRGPGVEVTGLSLPSEPLDPLEEDSLEGEMKAYAAEGLGCFFESLDGYHLEADEDFAFSLYETVEEWEEMIEIMGGTETD